MNNRPVFLSQTGAFTSAATNAIGDYSVTPLEIKVVCPENTKLTLNQLFVTVTDSSIDAAGYGGLPALTNGIRFYTKDENGTILRDRSSQLTVKTMFQWAAYCYEYQIINAGQGEDVAMIRYSFSLDGAPIILYPGESYNALLQDNLTGLTSHYFKLGCSEEGYYGI